MGSNRIWSRSGAEASGFTLLELLIVISILIVLTAILVLVINPFETLKRTRDAQRINDLNTLKRAIGLYLTSISSPYLAGASSNEGCKNGQNYLFGDKIYYSYPLDGPGSVLADSTLDGGSASIPAHVQVSRANLKKVDATGWLPVDLTGFKGGSPVSAYPVDPVNTVNNITNVRATDLVYRYTCDEGDMTFEIDANLESDTYTSDPENMEKDDGGNNDNLYEVGTKLNILGNGEF